MAEEEEGLAVNGINVVIVCLSLQVVLVWSDRQSFISGVFLAIPYDALEAASRRVAAVHAHGHANDPHGPVHVKGAGDGVGQVLLYCSYI